MDPKDEILGADYSEHNILPSPKAVEATEHPSTNGECQISQRPRFTQSDDKMSGVYKTYFTDDSATDRSRPPARDNSAFQHDEGV